MQKAEPVAEVEKEAKTDESKADTAKVKETETSVTVHVEDTNKGE